MENIMIVVNKCLVRTSDNTEHIYLVRGKTTIGARVKNKMEILRSRND